MLGVLWSIVCYRIVFSVIKHAIMIIKPTWRVQGVEVNCNCTKIFITFNYVQTANNTRTELYVWFYLISNSFTSPSIQRLQSSAARSDQTWFAEREFCHLQSGAVYRNPSLPTFRISLLLNVCWNLNIVIVLTVNHMRFFARTCDSSQLWMTLMCVTNHVMITIKNAGW